jgi:hypoxanthine phosphoribosyltransferase
MSLTKMDCKIVSWREIDTLCSKLAKQIEDSGFKPETIIALARSGFIPARILSDRLGVTYLVSLKVEHWLDTTGQHRDEATIPYPIPFQVEGRSVLMVDDIVDTGKSMKVSAEYVQRFNPKELKTAVMQYITRSIFKPDYYIKTVDGWVWFVYPWNYVEDLCNLTLKLINSGKQYRTVSEVRDAMKEYYQLKLKDESVEEILRTLENRGKIPPASILKPA